MWLVVVCWLDFRCFLHNSDKFYAVHITTWGPLSSTTYNSCSWYPDLWFIATTAAVNPGLSWYWCLKRRWQHSAVDICSGSSRCCHGNGPDAAAGNAGRTTYQCRQHTTCQCRCAISRFVTSRQCQFGLVVTHWSQSVSLCRLQVCDK